MDLKDVERFEINILDEINDILNLKVLNNINATRFVSEMSYLDRSFLNGIIRKVRPRKILELGVSAGGSSSIILNAIKDIEYSTLYSIDYNTNYYVDATKKTGFIVDERFASLKNKWHLYTEGIAAKFLDEVGGGYRFMLIRYSSFKSWGIFRFSYGFALFKEKCYCDFA